MLRAIFIFALISNVLSKNEEYKGFRVYNVKFIKQSQQDSLGTLKKDDIDFWRNPNVKYNVTGRAMVPPSHFDWFEERLAEMKVERDICIEDVYEFLKEDLSERQSLINNKIEETVFDFNAYYRYDVILNHLKSLRDSYSGSDTNVELVEYGVTAESRPLVYVKISRGITDKPVVIVEAGSNPREWVTIPSALNVVDRLLEDGGPTLDDLTWIVIPVLNPDGYEYTHTNLRFWSKSMSINSNLGFICPGVNINRNFDINWLVSDSSSSPCSHLYAGIEPISEIETRLIRDLFQQFKPTLFVSIQNHGKFITFPWNFEKAASGLFRRHYLRGLEIVKNLGGYELDSGAIALGERVSGTSTDFARTKGVLYTYNVGVEGTGEYGVIVPERDIRTVADEVWRAVSAAATGL